MESTSAGYEVGVITDEGCVLRPGEGGVGEPSVLDHEGAEVGRTEAAHPQQPEGVPAGEVFVIQRVLRVGDTLSAIGRQQQPLVVVHHCHEVRVLLEGGEVFLLLVPPQSVDKEGVKLPVSGEVCNVASAGGLAETGVIGMRFILRFRGACPGEPSLHI